MYEYYRLQQLRKVYSGQGWAMLIYYGILNVAVMAVMVVDAFSQGLMSALTNQALDEEQLTQEMMDHSGWGYFVAIGIGLLVLLLWKKPKYMKEVLWATGKPMKVGSFFQIFAIFTSAQLGAQVLFILLELTMNRFGFSMAESMESAGGSMDSLSMFLYVGLGAPISEELLFRGLVLRSMEPYGKKFAIFASALLFGLYHGNVIQIPFAFAVGLVLGYVTVEYNIGWAIVLHMFNNLILSDTLTRLLAHLPAPWPDLWFWIVIIACTIAAAIILIVKRHQIKIWLRRYQNDPLCARAFWSAPGIVTLVVVLGLLTGVSTITMITPIT